MEQLSFQHAKKSLTRFSTIINDSMQDFICTNSTKSIPLLKAWKVQKYFLIFYIDVFYNDQQSNGKLFIPMHYVVSTKLQNNLKNFVFGAFYNDYLSNGRSIF